ncbi:MAG: energy transducer TonB [Acidobacteriota bacterium]
MRRPGQPETGSPGGRNQRVRGLILSALPVALAAALIALPPGPAPPRQTPAIRPPVPSGTQSSARIRVISVLSSGRHLARSPKPKYPAEARKSRVEGEVVLRALIGKDGTIRRVEPVSGHPLLVEAAREAVLRWRYRPTLLNGEPVEVITDIAVTFHLPSSRGVRRPSGKQ